MKPISTRMDRVGGIRGALISGGAIALFFVYTLVGDRTFWGAWISVWPPVIWVFLFLPGLIRMRSPIPPALLGLFLVSTTEWPRFSADPLPRDHSIRLISWNVGAGNANWLEALESYDPDIVLVQENFPPPEAWDGFDWYATFDPAVLTRFPAEILPSATIGPWTEPQLLLTHIEGRRVLIANVRLMLPSAVMQLVDPLYERPIENYRTRISQYRPLAELLKETAERVQADSIILSGDFNIPARMPSLAPFRAFLRDAWLIAGSGWGATVTAEWPMSRIDHVWVSDDIDVISVRIARFGGSSDHRGLIVDFSL